MNEFNGIAANRLDYTIHKYVMLLIIINRERNKRFPEFFSSHRIMFVSL